ncbi:hypothetical protein EUGRSUZ_F01143 [Eucalyptus grandis]|uniref:Uncharacterized protein n=2 Tax=Eucalyptus grandis TaxID=71139 RepID=A0ACC3KEB4_EUCGR|nr:hypothetical protein EUGRSUZ_F01143 [Eucalyptus grandis]
MEPLRMQSPLNVGHLILNTAVHQDEFWGIASSSGVCLFLEILTIQMSPPRIFPLNAYIILAFIQRKQMAH